MKMTEYKPGIPCWVDLGSPDLAASKAFYQQLFGWNAEVGPDPAAQGYTIFTKSDAGPPQESTIAGAGPLMAEGQPTAWTTYVATADADESAGSVRQHGGQVCAEPFDVLDVGRMAIFADPSGAVFGVWQPKEFQGAGIVNEPGSLCWNELQTRDVDGAKAFYQQVFGWEAETHPFGESGYTEWKADGRPIGGMMAMGAGVPSQVPPHWLPYFATDDCDATVAAAMAAGGKVTVPPADIPSGRFSVLLDPHGAVFGVIKLAETPGS